MLAQEASKLKKDRYGEALSHETLRLLIIIRRRQDLQDAKKEAQSSKDSLKKAGDWLLTFRTQLSRPAEQ